MKLWLFVVDFSEASQVHVVTTTAESAITLAREYQIAKSVTVPGDVRMVQRLHYVHAADLHRPAGPYR